MALRARLLSIPLLLGVTSGLAFGCSVETESREAAADDAERVPLGKADNFGSCLGPQDLDFCGGKSYGNCYCDEKCEELGDCCADKVDVCEAPVEGDEGGSEDEGGDAGSEDGGDEDPIECFIECNLTCGQAFGCDCADKCGVEEPKPDFCVTDDQCGEGEFCATDICVGSCPVCLDCNHVCMPELDPEPEPEPDPALVCLLQCQSTCAEISGDCGCHEACGLEEPPPPTFCAADDHCPGDQVCDTTLCVPSCPLCADCNFVCVDP